MPNQRYESTLNTWLAEALTAQGLDARPENAQGGGKRLDVELRIDDLKIALEAERGLSAGKRAEAVKDADSRLRDELADCAIAICYPDNLSSASDLADCELLHTTRAPGDRTPAPRQNRLETRRPARPSTQGIGPRAALTECWKRRNVRDTIMLRPGVASG